MSDLKIEPWMLAAAEHIHKLRMGSLEVQFKMGLGATHPNLSNTEQSQMAQQLTIDAIARVLATHAPNPASVPIGPGDVVQVVSETPISGTFGMRMFAPGQMVVAKSVDQNNVYIYRSYGKVEIPLTHVTRIGRAVYWPDGSKVEEPGK